MERCFASLICQEYSSNYTRLTCHYIQHRDRTGLSLAVLLLLHQVAPQHSCFHTVGTKLLLIWNLFCCISLLRRQDAFVTFRRVLSELQPPQPFNPAYEKPCHLNRFVYVHTERAERKWLLLQRQRHGLTASQDFLPTAAAQYLSFQFFLKRSDLRESRARQLGRVPFSPSEAKRCLFTNTQKLLG